mgnify:CR=1 FL=1
MVNKALIYDPTKMLFKIKKSKTKINGDQKSIKYTVKIIDKNNNINKNFYHASYQWEGVMTGKILDIGELNNLVEELSEIEINEIIYKNGMIEYKCNFNFTQIL